MRRIYRLLCTNKSTLNHSRFRTSLCFVVLLLRLLLLLLRNLRHTLDLPSTTIIQTSLGLNISPMNTKFDFALSSHDSTFASIVHKFSISHTGEPFRGCWLRNGLMARRMSRKARLCWPTRSLANSMRRRKRPRILMYHSHMISLRFFLAAFL